MAVRKEKKCFSSFYTKTQLSDYVIHILTRHELFEIGLRVRKTHLSECSNKLLLSLF